MTIVVHPKIGWHVGPSTVATELNHYLNELDRSSIPFTMKTADDAGGFFETAINIARVSSVPHVLVFRLTNTSSYTFDTPPYHMSPEVAANHHWSMTRGALPAIVVANKDIVWVETENEVDKNRSDWLGRYAVVIGELMQREGYKHLAFGWSSGEPEIEHWQTAGMVQYLTYCSENPNTQGLGLHEYSYDKDNIWNGREDLGGGEYRYWLIGRFEHLHGVCDELGLNRPTIVITEGGWEYQDVALPPQGVTDLHNVAELYAPHFNILGFATWYLGPSYGGIADRARALITPATDMILSTVFEVEEPTPPPIDNECEREYDVIYVLSPSVLSSDEISWLNNRVINGFTLPDGSITHGLHTWTFSADDAFVSVGQGADNSMVIVVDAGRIGTGITEEWIDENYPSMSLRTVFLSFPSEPPVPPFVVNKPYAGGYTITSRFNEPRVYGLHEGIDLVPYDQSATILAGAIGHVEKIGYSSSGYGNYVRTVHYHGDRVYKIWYAHMSSVYVEEGQKIYSGTALGETGSTGNSTGPHLHITVCDIGHGLDGYVVDDVINPEIVFPELRNSYYGRPVSFLPAIHGPASDYMWEQQGFRSMMTDLDIPIKFMTGGIRPEYFPTFRKSFAPIRIFFKPHVYRTPSALWDEIGSDVMRFYTLGGRIFEVFNEPSLPEEGFGVLWHSPEEFGFYMLEFITNYLKPNMPEALFYYPGETPSAMGGNQYLFTMPAYRICKEVIDGLCVHAYTDGSFTLQQAVEDIVGQVRMFQDNLGYDKPIIVSESSVKDVSMTATQEHRSAIYKEVERMLDTIAGIEGVVWFVSDWDDPLGQNEGWYGTPLPEIYNNS